MSRKLKRALTIGAIILFGVVNLGEFDFADESVVHYETYRVRAGDTFWGVSQKYYNKDIRELYILEYHDELRELNPYLKKNQCQLNPNDVITVRYVTRSE